MKKLKKCLNCNRTYEITNTVKIDLGFAIIEQKQCPYCRCPIDTKITHKD